MLFVVTGPSGTGKTYLIKTLISLYPNRFISPPLITTRPPRAGSPELDRVSVSPEEFDAVQAEGNFAVVGKFQANRYGFPANIATQVSKHIIINAWPALIPEFAALDMVCLIGLNVHEGAQDVLRQRMIARGEDEVTVANRMQQVQVDMADLKIYRELVEANGAIFDVSSDTAIPEQVVPWILQAAA